MSTTTRDWTAGLLLVLLLAPLQAGADAIVVTRAMLASTIAEVFVEERAVRVELEIGERDLRAFSNLMPDWLHEKLGYEPEPLGARLARFFAEDLVIRSDGGPPLPGRIVEIGARPRIRRDEITGQPLPPGEDETETVVFAVLEYPLPARPASLSFAPPPGQPEAPVASIGFVVYHRGLPVTDFRYLGREEVLDLNWDDPWYSRFHNRNLRRQYDAPLNAFLYVEPTEVRAEIIARPMDLQQWVDLGLRNRDTIPVEMQEELKRAVGEFLAAHSPVTIDGKPARGTLDRVNFLRRSLRNSTVIDPPEELDTVSATLGVIFVYPIVGLPQEATLTWDLWSERIQRVPAAATDEAGPFRIVLEPDFPVLRWQNFLRNPRDLSLVDVAEPPPPAFRWLRAGSWLLGILAAALLLSQAGAALRGRRTSRRAAVLAAGFALTGLAAFASVRAVEVDDGKAREIVAALLHNVYRSFDFYEEGAIYDVLEQSVAGDLLAEIYLETRRSLVLASQGGARAKVKELELLDVASERLADGAGFRARCRWNVVGAVGHWGHIHTRTNQYEAELRVEPRDGRWRITRLEVLQEERL